MISFNPDAGRFDSTGAVELLERSGVHLSDIPISDVVARVLLPIVTAIGKLHIDGLTMTVDAEGDLHIACSNEQHAIVLGAIDPRSDGLYELMSTT